MHTAVDIQVTSFGTFLSSLCQEFCHWPDHRRFAFRGERRREDPRGEIARPGGNIYLECLPEADSMSLDKWSG
jgi:hypothetical protein